MAAAASDKKGIDIVIINMRKISGVCDRFVIVSGTSTTHVRALSDNIVKKLRESGARLKHIEGEREAAWILIDFGDVVGHVFLDDVRKRYDLEKLWSNAPQEKFAEAAPKAAVKPGKKVTKAKKTKKTKSGYRKVTNSRAKSKAKNRLHDSSKKSRIRTRKKSK